METIAFVGARCGLGRACFKKFDDSSSIESLLISRQVEGLQELAKEARGRVQVYSCDLSRVESLDPLLKKLRFFSPQRLFYFAGGGCYGDFASKGWKDHLWGLQVSLLSPAYLLHQLLKTREFPDLEQLVFVGSKVADDRPDPQAASYSAAKHGLKGLITSVQAENPSVDLRLFRPGYMDTDLLPPQAWPRLKGLDVASPEWAADQFYYWTKDPRGVGIYDL